MSESVNVFCKGLLPNGFVRIDVRYDRTGIRPIPGSIKLGITNRLYVPVMDLRDYAPCFYTWLYNGERRLEKTTLAFTNLTCVIEDNENLRRTVWLENQSGTPPAMREFARRSWPEALFRDAEEKRKHW